ncbi:MAG: AI-2E family transporter, partial [Gallionella sp.]
MNELNTKENVSLDENDWGSRSHIHTLLLMAVTVAGIFLCYRLSAPFIPAFVGALALAVLFAPLQRRLESKVKHFNLAALICVLVAALIVVVPAMFVLQQTVVEATRGAESIKAMVESGEWRRSLDAHPLIAPLGNWIERQFDLPEMANNLTSWLTSTAASFVQLSLMHLIIVVLTFYVFFYFLRDRNKMLESIRSLSPLSEADMDRMFAGVSNTVHATLYGTFAVAIVQGT